MSPQDTSGALDPLAVGGFSVAAPAYERGRPGYPSEALDWCCDELSLDARSRVLDLGAGTGKLTRSLVGRIGEVIAIEPLAAMRAQFRRAVPQVEIRAGCAEMIPVDDQAVSAVFSGEAFHWFVVPHALAEIRRVLRPNGGLAVMWNTLLPSGPWQKSVEDAIVRNRQNRRPWKHRPVGTFDDLMRAHSNFGPVQVANFPHEQRLRRAQIVDWVESLNLIAVLPPPRRAAALGEIETLLGLHGVDEAVLHWRCDAYLTRPTG